jgi:ketosteroid isomerase-like protein
MSDPWANATANLEAGERLFHTVEHGDLEQLRQIFADGAMVWHNTDERLTDVETTIRNLRAIRASASEFRYTEVRREPTPSGFVQQHILIVKTPEREIRDLCCCVCRVEDGRIAHMDAYHDSAATGAMAHRRT